jgi:NADH dehydrogenase
MIYRNPGAVLIVSLRMNKAKVLILGGGFAGIYCARELAKHAGNAVDITVVSEDNFFLFTPLLHEVASATLGLTDIVSPLREVLPSQALFLQGKVVRVDFENACVEIGYGDNMEGHRTLEYDHLVMALGADTNFHDTPGVKEHAQRMKTLADAIALRNKLIANLEKAQVDTDETLVRRRLTVVVCGGGFAGVETVGAVNDFIRDAGKRYDHVRQDMIRVVLVHHGDRLLPEISEKVAGYTARQLNKRGVEVVFKSSVTKYDGTQCTLKDGTTIATDTLIWTAGTRPQKFEGSDKLPMIKGALQADDYLRLKDASNVWVVGDCARIPNPSGGFYPPTAQHALREGLHVGRNIARLLRGQELARFAYKTRGQMASIGSRVAVAEVFGKPIVGFAAWLLWRGFYWSHIPDAHHKMRVAFNWMLDLIFPPDLVCLDTVAATVPPPDENADVVRTLGEPDEGYQQKKSA